MSDEMYTAEEVEKMIAAEVKLTLKGILRNLEDVHAQRVGTQPHLRTMRQVGELWGLGVAISAIKRRIR